MPFVISRVEIVTTEFSLAGLKLILGSRFA